MGEMEVNIISALVRTMKISKQVVSPRAARR